MALAAKAEEESKVVQEPWSGEPETIDQLLDRYIVEGKCSGRTAGTTLYLVQCKARDGGVSQALEGQKFKLFLVPRPNKKIIYYLSTTRIPNLHIETSLCGAKH